MRDKDYNMNEELEQTIAHLARHMQALREAVPVNYELKAKLKKRLLEQLKNKQAAETQSKAKPKINLKRLWVWLSVLGLLVVVMAGVFWVESKASILELTELGSFPAEDFHSEQPITVTEDGLYAAVEYKGSILLFTKEFGYRWLLADEEQGIFHSPAWANNQGWLAVVHEQDERSEVWLLQQNRQYASRLIYAEEGAKFSNLHWSPDDTWVMLSKEITASTAGAATREREDIQVRFDGSEVLRHAMIEKEVPNLEKKELLEGVRWSKPMHEKLESAEEIWLDWNKDQSALALIIRHEEQLELFLVKLRNKRLNRDSN